MDKRKENGGNSTKAKGVDKRKNEYRNAVKESVTYEDLALLLKKAVTVALSDDRDRLKAMQMVFEYTLGKPKESIDLSANIEGGIVFSELIKSLREDK